MWTLLAKCNLARGWTLSLTRVWIDLFAFTISIFQMNTRELLELTYKARPAGPVRAKRGRRLAAASLIHLHQWPVLSFTSRCNWNRLRWKLVTKKSIAGGYLARPSQNKQQPKTERKKACFLMTSSKVLNALRTFLETGVIWSHFWGCYFILSWMKSRPT